MSDTELQNKHLSELHALAAEAGVPRYRMLTRAELIDALGDGDTGRRPAAEPRAGTGERERPPRRRRRSGSGGRPGGEGRGREPRDAAEEPEKEADAAESSAPAPSPAPTAEAPARPRRRRRRRFGRRGKDDEVTIQGLLLPPEAGRQAILCAETREGCTELLRGVAADLSAASRGPDPVVLLIDPSPEELADWKREAPQAEIVAAGQPRHASDALAQAQSRASGGEDVMLLVDSLTRLAAASDDAEAAKELFDAGRATSGAGSLTVVAALERPSARD